MLMGLPNICSTLANVMMMIISHVCHCCKTVIRVWPAVVDICKEKLNKVRQVSASGHTSRYPVDGRKKYCFTFDFCSYLLTYFIEVLSLAKKQV